MPFAELACVCAASCYLLILLDSIDDHSAAAVCHCGDVLGDISLREVLDRGKLRLPVQIVSFDRPGRNRGVKDLVGKYARRQPERAVQRSEAHAPRIGMTTDVGSSLSLGHELDRKSTRLNSSH